MRKLTIRSVVIVEILLVSCAMIYLLSVFFSGSGTSEEPVPPDVIVLNDHSSAEHDYSYLLTEESLVAVRYTPKPRSWKPEPAYFVCRGDDLRLARSAIDQLLDSDELLSRPLHPGQSLVIGRFGYRDKQNGRISIKQEQRYKFDPDGPNARTLHSLRIIVCKSNNQVDHVPEILTGNRLMKYMILTEKFPD